MKYPIIPSPIVIWGEKAIPFFAILHSETLFLAGGKWLIWKCVVTVCRYIVNEVIEYEIIMTSKNSKNSKKVSKDMFGQSIFPGR
jgi:hypothetical protein